MDDRNDRTNARIPELADVTRICRALNEYGARYVLIGGFGVISHGLVRSTKDVGLLIDDSPENVALVKKALGVLSDNAAAEVANDDVRNYTVVRVADEVVVDLMGQAGGVRYEEAIQDAVTKQIQGVPVPVASVPTLMRTKETLRPSDAADRGFLQELLERSQKDPRPPDG